MTLVHYGRCMDWIRIDIFRLDPGPTKTNADPIRCLSRAHIHESRHCFVQIYQDEQITGRRYVVQILFSIFVKEFCQKIPFQERSHEIRRNQCTQAYS